MAFEQLFLEAGIGLGMGAVIAIVAYLADSKASWDNKQFAHAMIIGVFTAFMVIEGIEGGVGEGNIIKVLLLIAGASFFTNKGIQALAQIKK